MGSEKWSKCLKENVFVNIKEAFVTDYSRKWTVVWIERNTVLRCGAKSDFIAVHD